jgi:hypothetical protein
MISKKETFELLETISAFYEQFEINQSRIDSWHMAIKDYEFERLKDNLICYCRENKYPPKVADLVNDRQKILDRMNAIPDVEETRQYLNSISSIPEYTDDEKRSIEQSKAEIRKILGIG